MAVTVNGDRYRAMLNELMSFGPYYYFWGPDKNKCYALKDNIRKAIGEIQLHRVFYYMASRGSHLNEIFFHY